MALTRQQFFDQLIGQLEGDNQTSDVSYYVDGKATDADYRGVIAAAFERTKAGSAERQAFVDLMDDNGFWADTDDLDYWLNVGSEDMGAINDLKNVAMERLEHIGTPAQEFAQDPADDPDVLGPEGADPDAGIEGIMAS